MRFEEVLLVSAWRIWLVWCVPRFAPSPPDRSAGVLDPQALLRSSLLSPDQYPDLDTEIWPLLGAVGLAHCWKHTVALYQIHGSLCTSNTRWLLSLKANQTRKLFEKPRLPVYYFRPSNCIGVTVWAPTVDTRALPYAADTYQQYGADFNSCNTLLQPFWSSPLTSRRKGCLAAPFTSSDPTNLGPTRRGEQLLPTPRSDTPFQLKIALY